MGIKTAGKTYAQLTTELGHRRTNPNGVSVWYTPAETAALLRKRLAEELPQVKASVVTDVYSGGASIDVRWHGDPALDERVREIAGSFRAGDFDGMVDLYRYRPVEINGEAVHYGAGYVSCYWKGERGKNA